MNEMYNMSIVAHNYGVACVVGVIFINILMLYGIKNIQKYIRVMSLFMPIVSTMIGIVIFTGVVMMASKHLNFTPQNIVMIVSAAAIIYLDLKRSTKLKYIDKKLQNAFALHRVFAIKIFMAQIAIALLTSLMMWL